MTRFSRIWLLSSALAALASFANTASTGTLKVNTPVPTLPTPHVKSLSGNTGNAAGKNSLSPEVNYQTKSPFDGSNTGKTTGKGNHQPLTGESNGLVATGTRYKGPTLKQKGNDTSIEEMNSGVEHLNVK